MTLEKKKLGMPAKPTAMGKELHRIQIKDIVKSHRTSKDHIFHKALQAFSRNGIYKIKPKRFFDNLKGHKEEFVQEPR